MYFDEIIELDPKDSYSFYMLGDIYYSKDEYKAAIE